MQYLDVTPGRLYVDCTLGGGNTHRATVCSYSYSFLIHLSLCTLSVGGHTERILELGGKVIGIDRDMDAIRASTTRLQSFIDKGQLSIVHGNFGNIGDFIVQTPMYIEHRNRLQALATASHVGCAGGTGLGGGGCAGGTGLGGGGIDGGVLVDLGVSSFQIDTKGRGFAHSLDGPLDMRMNRDCAGGADSDTDSSSHALTASDIVNTYDVDALANVLYTYGNERLSRQIAREIVNARPIRSTGHLKSCIASITPRSLLVKTLSKCFQAIRIVTNDEMGEIDGLLRSLSTVVATPASAEATPCRVCVMSYHSLEDGRIKRWMKHGTIGDARGLPGGASGTGTGTSVPDLIPSAAHGTLQGQQARRQTHLAVKSFQGNSSRRNYKQLVKFQNATGELMRQSPAGRGTNSRAGQAGSGTCWRIVTREVVEPGVEEVYTNTRSRSAKLRVVEFVVPSLPVQTEQS